jgi:hypothetical protein
MNGSYEEMLTELAVTPGPSSALRLAMGEMEPWGFSWRIW